MEICGSELEYVEGMLNLFVMGWYATDDETALELLKELYEHWLGVII